MLERKLKILGRHNLLYTLLFVSHISSLTTDHAEVNQGVVVLMTYLNPSLAILYEPSHLLVVVVADDVDFRMEILAGKSCQIELRLVVGRGEG